jgi:methyl-accepting chemotaxis protein
MTLLRNLKIGTKFRLCGAILLVAGLMAMVGMREIALMTHLQKLERDHMETVLRFTSKAPQYLRLQREATPESLATAKELLTARSDICGHMGLYQLLDTAEAIAHRMDGDTNFIEEFVARKAGFGQTYDLAATAIGYWRDTRGALRAYSRQEISLEALESQCRSTIEFATDNAHIFASLMRAASLRTRDAVCTLTAIILAFALLVLIVIARSITAPLKKGIGFARRLAEGDLTRQIHVDRADEIGDLATAMNRMASNLADIVGRIRTASSEMEAASNEQAAGASNQSTATAEMSATASELLATAQKMAENGTSVSGQASAAANECASGVSNVQEAVQGINGIRSRVDRIAEHMVDLSGKSQQISGVLDIINELAEQTNLLSLNASIEAAGAGEAGKRFAVVASEIRKLAERAAESTTEIRGLIDGVQETVNATVMATEEGTKAVEHGVHLAEKAQGSFEHIASQVASTRESAKAIELASRQQATALEQVDGTVRSIDTSAQQAEATSRHLQSEAQALSDATRRFRLGRKYSE